MCTKFLFIYSETFNKIEEIVTRVGKTAASIRSLQDIAEKETVKSSTNKVDSVTTLLVILLNSITEVQSIHLIQNQIVFVVSEVV